MLNAKFLLGVTSNGQSFVVQLQGVENAGVELALASDTLLTLIEFHCHCCLLQDFFGLLRHKMIIRLQSKYMAER